MIRIEVVKGEAEGSVFEFEHGDITIGRGEGSSVHLDDTHLSTEHGLIFHEQGQYVYRDLRSTNGSMLLRGQRRILLDGTDRWESRLSDDDQLLLGDAASPVILRCRIIEGSASATETQRIIATRRLDEMPKVVDRLKPDVDLPKLHRAFKLIGANIELESTLEAVAAASMELVDRITHVTILLCDSSDDQRFIPVLAKAREANAAVGGITMSRTMLSRVLEERAAVLAADAADEFGRAESILGANIQSTIGVPLWQGEDIFGVLQVDNRATSAMLSEPDLDLLLVLAEQAALAIQNARYYQQLKVAQEKVEGENKYLRRRQKSVRLDGIIGESPPMKKLFEQVERVVDTRATVCIFGETGTGKELFAHAIHHQSKRRTKMFVAQNCAALPDSLLESELFGHRKGSFTGATQDKKGLFEIADGGTLFLDEIGEMPVSLQAKLLRALQEGEVRPVGATTAKRVDVRIICATNRNLENEVKSGAFREDLFYRLMVFPMHLPPLRDRAEDIPKLANHFLRTYSEELRKSVQGISQEAMNLLIAYRWPGNIRELENEMQRLMIQADENGFIEADLLSPSIRSIEGSALGIAKRKGSLKEMLERFEKHVLVEALKAHDNNKTKTAKSLGITREGLHKKLTRFGL